ncbi:MAG TPA: PASTA domain-containing protein, partial [Gaiellaceae bacterium]
ASRLAAMLPRFIVLAIIGLLATATFTFAAEKQIVSTPVAKPAPAAPPVLVVPAVQRQAYVFAKGILQDAGFAWKVEGPVRGYAANTVFEQQPAPGTRVRDTGAPLVVLHLAANPEYDQHGLPEDVSPYKGTEIRLVDAPAVPKAPVVKKPAAKKPVVKERRVVQRRPPAFAVPGARKEPLDEIPLTERAERLRAWLGRHPRPTTANVRYWLYQNSWIVTGARFGWWHGAEALRVLIAANVRAQKVWGIGLKSEARARAALVYVRARSR